MRKLLPFLVLIALAGCNQGPKVRYETRFEPKRPKALIAERVEGQSPWKILFWISDEPRANEPTTFQFTVLGDKELVQGADAHVSLVMPLMDMGKNEFDAKEVGPGVYRASGIFTMGDEWEIFVTVTKDGKKGVHVFNVRVQE